MASDKEQAFINDLIELSKKHKMIIGGCGCCGSPFLLEFDEEITAEGTYIYDNQLEWEG